MASIRNEILSPNGEQILFRVLDGINTEEGDIFHSKPDLLLALYLALIHTSIDGYEGYEPTNKSKGHFYKPYINTLPENESYNDIPRRWSADTLNDLLGGTSSLLRRVNQEKAGLVSDYNLIRCAWHKTIDRGHKFPPLPTFSLFDQCMAIVQSRAFQGLGGDNNDALIPVMDLLNHKRGVGQSADVRYKLIESAEDFPVKYVVLMAANDLMANSTIRNTYGAKGNSQLLNRYGFCIPRNIEPDGSCNDVLEITNKYFPATIELRAGPKSYTFGGFARALECCRENDGDGDDGAAGSDDQSDDDMEAFLSTCEQDDGYCLDGEDEEGSNMFSTNLYSSSDAGLDRLDEGNTGTCTTTIMKECKAIEKLAGSLKEIFNGYSLQKERLAIAVGNSSRHYKREYQAALLVLSEQRIIRCHSQAIGLILDFLEAKLDGMRMRFNRSSISAPTFVERDDEILLSHQAKELMDAYLKIRHPGLNLSSTANKES